MSISSDYLSIVEDYSQISTAIEARKLCKNLYYNTQKVNTQIANMIADGNFDLIPASLKTALNRWRNMYVSLENAIEGDDGIMELLHPVLLD